MIRLKYALSFLPREYLYLDAWSDYGFALAHLVLEDAKYAAHYRSHRQPVILDNSFHELGRSLGIDRLLNACNIIQPAVLVAPDRIDDPDWTVVQAQALHARLPFQRLGLVVTGHNADEMFACYMKYYEDIPNFNTHVVCLPYKCDRVGFLRQLRRWVGMDSLRDRRIALSWHLLGFHNVGELRQCASLLAKLGIEASNFDTAKPLNYAYSATTFDPEISRSGEAFRPPFDGFNLIEDDSYYIHNVLKLRDAISTTNWQEVADGLPFRDTSTLPGDTSGV
jgi:hypothetical protein